jgi:two-component system nitrate/nitrite response regulator NarL
MIDMVHVLAVNSGRLWREGLAKLLEGTEFVLHDDPAAALSDSELLSGTRGRTIILYRERGFTDANTDWIRQMRQRAPGARIVIVTGEPRLSAFRQAMDAGADGYLTDDICGRTFVRMLALLLDGEKVISSALAELVTDPTRAARRGLHLTDIAGLSPAEGEIICRVVRGESNKQIANALRLTESTVKGRIKVLLQKINASNRTQAAIWALNHGLVQAPTTLPAESPQAGIALSA